MKPQAVLFLEPKGTALEVIRTAALRGFQPIVLRTEKSFLEHATFPYRSAVELVRKTIELKDFADHSAVLRACEAIDEEFTLSGVYFSLDLAAPIGAILRERYGLPTTPAAVYERILDKFELRRTLRENGLSAIENFSGAEMAKNGYWPFAGKAYFKPRHGFFSAYVKKCANRDHFEAARAAFHKGDPSDPEIVRRYVGSGDAYHVESAFPGELLSLESISVAGNFKAIGLLSRILFSKDPVVEMGSCFPYPHPLAAQIERKVEEAFRVLGFSDGPAHTEVIVSDQGEIEIIDLNPRFVGADVLQSINHAYGIKFQERLCDYALGSRSRDFTLPELKQHACLQYVLPPNVETFQEMKLPEEVDVPFKASFLKPGTRLHSHERQLDYVGCYLTTGSTFSSAMDRSRELRKKLVINGSFEGVY